MPANLLERNTAPTIRPFGLTTAVPVRPVAEPLPTLTLCPKQQINLTEDGVPFIFEPSMKSAFETVAQTQEDHQLDESKENDTD